MSGWRDSLELLGHYLISVEVSPVGGPLPCTGLMTLSSLLP